MKKVMTMMLGLSLLTGATAMFADDTKPAATDTTTKPAKPVKKAKKLKKTTTPATSSTEKKS
jgi:hypothetical protein